MNKTSLLAAALAALLAGCATLEPALPAADTQIRGEWPIPATVAPGAAAPADGGYAADIGWRDFFVDDDLREVVRLALENNRDLRVAALNVERARAQYRIQRSERVPAVGANVTMERTGGDVPGSETYSAGVGIASFELDLFGRVRSLSNAALQQWFAQTENRAAVQIGLVGEVANVWLALAGDLELLRLSEATLRSQQESLNLTEKRHSIGVVSGLDVAQARTQVEAARADVARQQGAVAQDTNALTLLVGQPLPEALLPTGLDAGVTGLRPLPAGLPSTVLLRRPDIVAAEHVLRSANANIGAARAAFFPSISLTGSIGSASTDLSGLSGGGSTVWRFAPQVNLPIFQGGRLRANLGMATADRDIALARYEQAIQAGFRDVADALALSATLERQRQAQEALVAAASRANDLAQARYRAGQDSYLVRLDAQRTLYQAQQGLAAVRAAEQANRVTLYRALGGGWKE
jgi:multidrug efflux system outer membrane protein